MSDTIFTPITLPCGRIVQNRLVKVAMYEHLAGFLGGPPNTHHLRLYSEWAKHDWSIVVTGNVQVASDHLTLGRDIVLPQELVNPKEEDLGPFRRLADAIHGVGQNVERNKTLAIMQLSHAGRQSANFIGGRRFPQRPKAPSAVRVGSSTGRKVDIVESFLSRVLFQNPKEMTEGDILHVIDRFVDSAVFAHKAGFDGVQLHVAHGYLLCQFLSPSVNKRADSYSFDKALEIIRTIISQIRDLTPSDFVISIKLNAADYTNCAPSDTLTEHEQRALQHLLAVASWTTVDFIEVSGGDYETPDFLAPTSTASGKHKLPRQAFFTRFSQQAVKTLSSLMTASSDSYIRPLILLTGGLRTPALLNTALSSKHADLLGIGRAAVRSPDIPTILRSQFSSQQSSATAIDDCDQPFQPEPDVNTRSYPPASWLWYLLMRMKFVGAGGDVAWHTLVMRDIARLPLINSDGETKCHKLDYNRGGLYCVLRMFFWKSPAKLLQYSNNLT